MSARIATKLKTKGVPKPLPNNKVLITLKLDKEVKKHLFELCDEFGISMSALFTIFAKRIIKDKKSILKTMDLGVIYTGIKEEIKKLRENKLKV